MDGTHTLLYAERNNYISSFFLVAMPNNRVVAERLFEKFTMQARTDVCVCVYVCVCVCVFDVISSDEKISKLLDCC